jgi:predicted DCC family thiol-disulfide oxidoreductase YuxK
MPSEKPLLIFDGDCSFCTSSANFIVKYSSLEIVAEPWQYLKLADYGITQAQASAKVQLWLNGKIYAGHVAVAKLLQGQKNPFYRLIGVLALFPILSQIARFLYFLTAKYRHKLPGGTPACQLTKR